MTTTLHDNLASRMRPLIALCETYCVRRLYAIGSGTRGDFDPESSDIDFVVEFDDDFKSGPFDQFFGLQVDLEDLFAREIDLIELAAVKNRHLLDEIVRTRRLVYEHNSRGLYL